MFEVGDDPGPLPALVRITDDALDDRRTLEADEEGLEHVAEAVVVPQERSYPRKQPEEDLGQSGHAWHCPSGCEAEDNFSIFRAHRLELMTKAHGGIGGVQAVLCCSRCCSEAVIGDVERFIRC